MNYINITVRGKIARAEGRARVVCGNSDYAVCFGFDAEWSEYAVKTARFVSEDGSYTDVQFAGDTCAIPILRNTRTLLVGVFAGNLRTTTAALIHAVPCITDPDGTPADPTPDVYAQLMERFNAMEAPAAVLYTAQELTNEQKATARENIGVATPDWEQNDETAADYIKNRPFYEGVIETLLDPTIENWRTTVNLDTLTCSWRVAGVDYIDVVPTSQEGGAVTLYELGSVSVAVLSRQGLISVNPSDADVHLLKRESNIKQIDPKFIPERLFDATGATNAEITAALQENKLCYVRDADGFWFCNSYDYFSSVNPYYSAIFYRITTEGINSNIGYISKLWTSDNGFYDKRIMEAVSTIALKDMAMTVVDAYDEISPQSGGTVNGICVGAGSSQGGKVPPSGMTFPIIFSLGPTSHGTGSAWIRDADGVVWKGSTDYGTLRVTAVPANRFIVRVTQDGNGNFTADKTIAEILEAYEAGKDVVMSNGTEFPLYAISQEERAALFNLSNPRGTSQGLIINDTGVILTNNLIIPRIYPVEKTSDMTSPVGVDTDGKLWSKADTSLNMTGATVGQIAKITAVDDSGRPTAWEAVDMPTGGKMRWQKVGEFTTTEQTNLITLNKDSNGTDISDYNAIALKVDFDISHDSTQTSTNGAVWIYPYSRSDGLSTAFRMIASISQWKNVNRKTSQTFFGDINGLSCTGNQSVGLVLDQGDKAWVQSMLFNGATLYIHNSGDHFPVGTIVSFAVLSDRE